MYCAQANSRMAEWSRTIAFGLTLLIMLVGLFGQIIPVFPGIVVIWVAALGYGVVTSFNSFGWIMFAIITLLMLVGVSIDNVLMGAGAKQSGASWASLGIMLVAGTLGTLFFPPFGGLIAMPLAVLIYEYFVHRDWKKAWKIVGGLASGWGVSFFVRLGLSVAMIVAWMIWDFLR